jgi:hypothetical protein
MAGTRSTCCVYERDRDLIEAVGAMEPTATGTAQR